MYRQSEKLLNSNISSTCPHNMVNFSPLAAEIVSLVCGTPANFSGFTSWLRYCSDIAQRTPTKRCKMFGRLLGWYTIYTFSGAVAALRKFAMCKIYIASKSCTLLYCSRCCTALEQRPSAKLCGAVQGMKLRNFR